MVAMCVRSSHHTCQQLSVQKQLAVGLTDSASFWHPLGRSAEGKYLTHSEICVQLHYACRVTHQTEYHTWRALSQAQKRLLLRLSSIHFCQHLESHHSQHASP